MVTPIMPENTALPMACRISEPAPVANTSGTTPAVKAIDVINIGRKRIRQASIWRLNVTSLFRVGL